MCFNVCCVLFYLEHSERVGRQIQKFRDGPQRSIQWVCARLFAPSVGHESVEGGRVDSWNCQFWNATYWEVLEFTSKGIKTKYSASPKGRLLKYGGISDEGFLFPDTQSSFLSFTASFWGKVLLCHKQRRFMWDCSKELWGNNNILHCVFLV